MPLATTYSLAPTKVTKLLNCEADCLFDSVKMPREKDFAWTYCEKIPGSTKLLCKFCREHGSGGIYRFKFHIAKIHGHEIIPCKAIPEDVRH